MKSLSLSLALLLSLGLAACGGGDSAVVGTWELDVGALMDEQLKATGAGASGEMADKVKEMMKEQFKQMKIVFEFKADKTCTMGLDVPGKKETGTGTWERSGDTVTITPKTSDGKPVEGKKAEKGVFTLKGDTMRFKPSPDAPEFVLKRK